MNRIGQNEKKQMLIRILERNDYKHLSYQELKEHRMGVECVRQSPKQTPRLQPEPSSRARELAFVEEMLHFQLKIYNVYLNTECTDIDRITFCLPKYFQLTFSHNHLSIDEKILKWKQPQQITFEVHAQEIEDLKLGILIESQKDRVIQRLSLSLSDVCTGPLHHDHLLKLMTSRLSFDMEINQTVSVYFQCQKFDIDNVQNHQNETKDSYAHSLTLMTNSNLQMDQGKIDLLCNGYDEKSSIEKDILSSELKESSLRVVILKEEKSLSQESIQFNYEIFGEIYIPYRIILKNCETVGTFMKDERQFERRKMSCEEYLCDKGKNIRKVTFDIICQTSRNYVEQLEGLIRSENGISTLSPQYFSGGSGSSVFKQSEPQLNIKQLQDVVEKFRRVNPRRRNDIHQLMRETIKTLNTDSETFENKIENIEKLQSVLVELLWVGSSLIREGEELINEQLWRIFNLVLHRSELSIRCVYAIQNYKVKKKLGGKLYGFICSILSKIVQSTAIGFTYHELQCIQKFVAYAYFRFPWLQKKLIRAIKRQGDPVINQEKLTELGACPIEKSPSKSIVYDWEYSLFNEIKGEIDYLQKLDLLEDIAESLPDWAVILFNRKEEDLYYGMLIELLNEAENFLTNQEKVMWEYFPYYGEIIGSFLGEMSEGRITEYSPLFQECSIKLIRNEKLLNSFIMLLFPKTCLYETNCVMKCLDLVRCCFSVIVGSNNSLPTDFNFNFFYTGIISIFESNHSYLLIKVLEILYSFYDIFSCGFRKMIDQYIFNKIFHQLFLHWCGHVRKMFYYLLEHKIARKFRFYQLNLNDSLEIGEKSYYFIDLLNEYKKIIRGLIDRERTLQKRAKKIQEEGEYHLKMKQKLKMKKEKRGGQKKKSPVQNHCFDSPQLRQSTWSNESVRSRKWSVSIEGQTRKVPSKLQRYLLQAMKEFREIKEHRGPDEGVEIVMEIFRTKKNVDA